MVLVTLDYLKYLIIIFILASGCQSEIGEESTSSLRNENPEQFKVKESVAVNEINLQLTEKGSACFLRYYSGEKLNSLPLSLTPPCYFILNHDGQVRREYYNHLPGVVTIIIVLGDKPSIDPLIPVSTRNDCGSKWKGILISKNDIQVSSRIGEGLACAGVGLDEKEYRLFIDTFSR